MSGVRIGGADTVIRGHGAFHDFWERKNCSPSADKPRYAAPNGRPLNGESRSNSCV